MATRKATIGSWLMFPAGNLVSVNGTLTTQRRGLENLPCCHHA